MNPATSEFCKYTRPSLTAHPQQIASSGSGATLQSFFTEAGAGEGGIDNAGAVSVLTQAASVPETSPCLVAFLFSGALSVSTFTASVAEDIVITPRTQTITPLVTTVTASSGLGIDRFPMPFPTGGSATRPNAPSGMTGVALANTVFGSYSLNSAVFALNSAAIIAPPPAPPTCSSADATLVNEKFVSPTLTYDISSTTRVLSAITLTASTNIGSDTVPVIQPGGHSATNGSLTKTDTTKKATFTLQFTFGNPSFVCSIDPTIKGHGKKRGDRDDIDKWNKGDEGARRTSDESRRSGRERQGAIPFRTPGLDRAIDRGSIFL